jgi:hypothetical protein
MEEFPACLQNIRKFPIKDFPKLIVFYLKRAGGMWRSSRSVTTDLKRWDECLECCDFEDCYKLSMAKLALETAIQNR